MRRILPLMLILPLFIGMGRAATNIRDRQRAFVAISPMTRLLPAESVQALMHLTLHADGSAEAKYTFSVDRKSFSNYLADPRMFPVPNITQLPGQIDMLLNNDIMMFTINPQASNAGKDSWITTPVMTEKTVGFTACKHLHDLVAVRDELFKSQGNGIAVTCAVERGFFSDHFRLDMATGMLQKRPTLPHSFPPFFYPCGAPGMQLMLTLPARVTVHNGAMVGDRQNTLAWNIDFTQTGKVHAEYTRRNTPHLILVSVLGILLLGAIAVIAFFVWRNWKILSAQQTAHPTAPIPRIEKKSGTASSPFSDV